MRYLRKGGGEPKVIYLDSPRLDFEDSPYFKRFTVEKDKLIIDRSGFNWIPILFGGIVMYFFRYTFYYPLEPFTRWTFMYICDCFIFLLATYIFLKGILGYKVVFIFDRDKGTVTYPDIGLFHNKTIPFDDACFSLTQFSRINGEAYEGRLRLIQSIAISSIVIQDYSSPRELYSFLVWFMDKNRPLPLGKKFDTFRKEDFERRRAEGFPKPLYPADIRIVDLDGKESLPKESTRVNLSRKNVK